MKSINQGVKSTGTINTNNLSGPAKTASDIIRGEWHRMSTSIKAYAGCMEEGVEQLHRFRGWTVPKIATHEI